MSVQAEATAHTSARELGGRVAIVTGGAKGIGRGIVEALARHGASVAIADPDVDEGGRVADALARGGMTGRTLPVDVTSWETDQQLARDVIAEFGQIDILVNNAGVSKSVPFVDIDEEEWDRVFNVNVKGMYLATRAVLPHMIERRFGKIVNVSSMVGKEAIPLFVHYSASKFAVIGMTQGIAKEVAEYGINVNAVCPGVVRTPLWEPLLDQLAATKGITRDEAFEEFVAGIPLGRPQDPRDIGEVVAFLVSEKARNMTGQGINVTGGMQLH